MTYITRPPMTAAELRTHQVTQYGRDYRFSDDGYSDMEVEQKRGWKAIAGWGRDGWDLGNWPYVAIYIRNRLLSPPPEAPYELMQVVEGDRTVWTFTSPADRAAAIDYLFLWHAAGEDWAPLRHDQRAELDDGMLTVDEKFRGPFTRTRLDEEYPR